MTRLVEELKRETKTAGNRTDRGTPSIRLPEVLNLLGISKATLYRRIRDGLYPRPHHPSVRVSAWYLHEIEAIVRGLRSAV